MNIDEKRQEIDTISEFRVLPAIAELREALKSILASIDELLEMIEDERTKR